MSHTALYASIAAQEAHFSEWMNAEEIILEAMRAARKNWMTTNENELFGAAMILAYSKLSDADKPRLKASLDGLKALSAMVSGVPVDIEAVIAAQEGIDPLPIIKLWQESK